MATTPCVSARLRMEALPLLGETRVAVGDCHARDASAFQLPFAVTPSTEKWWSRSGRALAVAGVVSMLACAGVALRLADTHAMPFPTSTNSLGGNELAPPPNLATGAIHRGEVPYSTLDAADLGKVKRDPDTVVTIGFLSSGDFFWLPMVKLLEAAFPGVHIRLTDPTYNWRALGLEEAKGIGNVQVTTGPVEPDFVLEGPDIFKTACFWENLPWVETTAEPTMFFNTWNWCAHDVPAFARLDTGLGHYKQPTVYDENVTSFVWRYVFPFPNPDTAHRPCVTIVRVHQS